MDIQLLRFVITCMESSRASVPPQGGAKVCEYGNVRSSSVLTGMPSGPASGSGRGPVMKRDGAWRFRLPDQRNNNTCTSDEDATDRRK